MHRVAVDLEQLLVVARTHHANSGLVIQFAEHHAARGEVIDNRIEFMAAKGARSGQNKERFKDAGFAAAIRTGKDIDTAALSQLDFFQIANTTNLQAFNRQMLSCTKKINN